MCASLANELLGILVPGPNCVTSYVPYSREDYNLYWSKIMSDQFKANLTLHEGC